MTYIEAERIRQDFFIRVEFADIAGKERIDAIKDVAEKYTNEECMEFEAFYNQLKEKYFGKI